MDTKQDVRSWAEVRLAQHRMVLEQWQNTEVTTAIARGRIAELKELLVALDGQVPPVWIDAS